MVLPSVFVFRAVSCGYQRPHQFRHEIRNDADHARRSQRHHRPGERVVAAQNGDVTPREEIGHPVDVTGCVLDGDDVGKRFPQANDDVVGEAYARSQGYVVQHQRQIHRLAHGGEVAKESVLRRQVVIGCYEKGSAGAGVRCRPREFDRGGCRVRAGSNHNAATTVHAGYDAGHQLVPLRSTKRG